MMKRRTRLLVPLAAAVLLVVAGCGDETDDPPEGGDAGQESPAAPEPTATESPEAEMDATVAVSDAAMGEILVDAEGRTLYMFDQDQRGASTCYEGCEPNWPPLVVDSEPVAGAGVDQALLGTVEREDGSQQVTYADWPLYYYAQDSAAGDLNGQSVDGVWWVLGPTGEPIRSSGGPPDY